MGVGCYMHIRCEWSVILMCPYPSIPIVYMKRYDEMGDIHLQQL